RPPRGVERLRGAGVRGTHVRGHRAPAAGGFLAREAARGRGDIRQYPAHHLRLDRGLLVRLVRQQLRAGENEAVDVRPLAVDADRRLDALRGAGRFRAVLHDGVRRGVARTRAARRDRHAVRAEIGVGDRHDTGDLAHRRVPQAFRAGGLLRSRLELYDVHVQVLTRVAGCGSV